MQGSVGDLLRSACIDGAKYRQTDNVGKVLAHISLLPYLALFYQTAVVYSRREISEGLFLLGSLVNIACGRVLKKAIHQVRPVGTCEALGICDKPGMPSSHCQVMFFLLGLELLQVCRKSYKFRQDSWQCLGQLSTTSVYSTASLLVAYSRLYLGYHDLPQVLAGAAAGLFMSAVCFGLTSLIAGYFPSWQQLRLGSLFRVKDTWHINDVLLFEYNNTVNSGSKKLL